MGEDSWSNTVVKFVNSCKSARSYLRTGAVNNHHTACRSRELSGTVFLSPWGKSGELWVAVQSLGLGWAARRNPAWASGAVRGCNVLGASEAGHSTWAVRGAVTSVIPHQAVLFGFNNALVMKTTDLHARELGFMLAVNHTWPWQEALVLKPGACSQNTCWCSDRNTWLGGGTGLQVPMGVVAACSSCC